MVTLTVELDEQPAMFVTVTVYVSVIVVNKVCAVAFCIGPAELLHENEVPTG
jgi:hypothetical protein